MTELYRKYRPKKLTDMIGQPQAVKVLTELHKKNKVPHALLFSGPSGCGKTTLARIMVKRMKVGDGDVQEINAASSRGIDTAREIASRCNARAISGDCRAYVIDEAHQLTGDAQTALLKVVEDPPSHAYFMFCTTHRNKIIPTLANRCTEIKVAAVSQEDVRDLVMTVAEKEEVGIDAEVCDRIAEVADGSPRKALVILEQVIGLPPEERMDAIQKSDVRQQAFDLAKALMPWKGKPSWNVVRDILKNVEDDPEGVRRLVLAFGSGCMLKGNQRAYITMQAFRDPFFDQGTAKAMLILASYEACNGS